VTNEAVSAVELGDNAWNVFYRRWPSS